ncbi:MAG: cache domain-containing protein [candidate division WOR-3 bacterium]
MFLRLTAKFTLAFLLIVLIIGVTTTWVGIRFIANGIVNQAQSKVKSDINAAREIYNDYASDIADLLRLNAERLLVKQAISTQQRKALKQLLDWVVEKEKLDILSIVDSQGKVIFRLANPHRYGDVVNNDIVKVALKNKEVVVSTCILEKTDLLKEGNEKLVQKATIKIFPTPMAKTTEARDESSIGMVILAAAPVFSAEGEFIGVIYGGRLLNKNYDLVDKIKEVVFGNESYKGKDIGTATIFQGDLRISTNVRREDGERAIGTRIAANVYDQVLGRGESYYDRAFVVNNWYLTAYEPIRDINGGVIGILYVGILEEKYADMRKRTISIFLAIVIMGMGVAIFIAHFLGRTILKPLDKMVQVSRQIANGNFDVKVDVTTSDEVGELANAFNMMIKSLKERESELKEYTQQQIMRSERLATLGQLSAGVAHEINNPLTGVLTYIRLIKKRLEKRSDADGDFRRYLDKVENETERVSTIVKNLLDFARQRDPNLKLVDVNLVISESLDLLEHKIRLQNITVETNFATLPRITADFSQLQQVFMNLIINAVEAMEQGGKLTITTEELKERNMLQIMFKDTGVGIPKEHLTQIFEPFFTTKPKGTGMGLSVVYGIISRHNGEIEVNSEVGKGTTFTIRLPITQNRS